MVRPSTKNQAAARVLVVAAVIHAPVCATSIATAAPVTPGTVAGAQSAAVPPIAAGAGGRAWPGEEMPLPLAVKTAQDLAIKALAERQYLLFNLLAGGKVAWDAGDYATAARKWEDLLRVPKLDPEVERVVRAYLVEARSRPNRPVARSADAPLPLSAPAEDPSTGAMGPAGAIGAPGSSPNHIPSVVVRPIGVVVGGTVRGGGATGPAGTVLWLRRLDGPMPRTRPGRPKVISQLQKNFVPHVAVVTPGTSVLLRNDDNIFHNVFSAVGPNHFDSGMYQKGASYKKAFDTPGPVELLCNIHASMLGWVYVVDSPYYAQAGSSGDFKIGDVPPGRYQIEAWNEASTRNYRKTLDVGPEGIRGLTITVGNDKRVSRFVLDKYGKPRQPQLGY